MANHGFFHKIGSIFSRGRDSVHSFLDKEICIQGDVFIQEGGLHIEGQVLGNIIDRSEKARVVVGHTGLVRGSIQAHNLVLLGRIEGNVHCTHFEIFGDASIEGDIEYHSISLHKGRISGRLLPYQQSEKEPKALAEVDILEPIENNGN